MHAVLVGAGFSKCTAGLPLARELFDFDIRPRGDRESRKIELIRADKTKWEIENPNGEPEQFVGWSLHKSSTRRKRITWYITRRLSVPFRDPRVNGAQTFMINEKFVQGLDCVSRTRKLLSPLVGDVAGIITTNYDMLLEYAMGTKLFNYGRIGERLTGRGHNPSFPWQNTPVILSGHIPIAKIHGSVSWNSSARFTDGRCGLRGDALIVPPYPDKTGSKLMPEVWQLARTILRSADRLVIFGLALNEYDEELLSLLADSASGMKEVVMIDPRPNVQRASILWPGVTITTRDPPTYPTV